MSETLHRVPCVVVIRDSVVDEHILCRDAEHAERVFLDKLAERLSNWDEYDADDRQAVLDDGYEEFGNGSVCLSWAMSPDADEEEPAPAAEEPEDENWFLNYYRCPKCQHEWQDEWSATCDDECPACGERDISPYKSDDLPKPE